MHIRTFDERDLAAVTDLTIATFRPFYEESFRPLVGEAVFANQHGNWEAHHRRHAAAHPQPSQGKLVVVADADGEVAGYVAFTVNPARHDGEITHVAVSTSFRRHHLGTALCEQAFTEMKALGA